MPAMPAPEPPTMRERYRAQVRGEVKQAALSQLAESGPAGLSVSAIGKQLGVSGPALYRYFASRDELLTELAIDAYDDLADALRAAASQVADPQSRAPGSKHSPRTYLVLGAGSAAPVPAAIRAAAAWLRRARATTRGRLPSLDEPAARRSARTRGSRRPRTPRAASIPAHCVGAGTRPRHRPSDCPARRACLEPPARPGEPGNRWELRVHGHQSRPGLRGAARHAHRMKTRLSATQVLAATPDPPGSQPTAACRATCHHRAASAPVSMSRLTMYRQSTYDLRS